MTTFHIIPGRHCHCDISPYSKVFVSPKYFISLARVLCSKPCLTTIIILLFHSTLVDMICNEKYERKTQA